jgi:hypothetical protein
MYTVRLPTNLAYAFMVGSWNNDDHAKALRLGNHDIGDIYIANRAWLVWVVWVRLAMA